MPVWRARSFLSLLEALEGLTYSARTSVELLPHVGDAERTGAGPRLDRPVEPHIDAAALPVGDALVAVPPAPGSAVMFDGWAVHRSAPNKAGAPRQAMSFGYARPR